MTLAMNQEDVDDHRQRPSSDEEPSTVNKSSDDAVLSTSPPSSTASKPTNNEQEFIFIHDTGFTVKIHAPGCEPFDIQVLVALTIIPVPIFISCRSVLWNLSKKYTIY